MRKFTYKTIVFLLFLFAATANLQAQDPHFSQFYASPLYTNPSLSGSEYLPRIVLNYRNQWTAIDANFITYSASVDVPLNSINSGAGLLVTRDEAPSAGMQSIEAAFQYSYELYLNDVWSLRMGMQGSYAIRSNGFSNLRFGDQFNNQQGFTGGASAEQFNQENFNYANLAAGFFLYNDLYWLGFSAHNLLRPDLSAFPSAENGNLPIRYTLQLGTRILLYSQADWRDIESGRLSEISISPALLYKRQGPFEQLDLGVYFNYDMILFGAWYRGIPIKTLEGVPSNESLIAMVGVSVGNLNIGYSYDYTISPLGAASGGAHEISLILLVEQGYKRGVKREFRPGLPCPKL